MNTTNTKQLFLFLLGVLLAGTVYGIRNDAAEQEGQRREGRVERSADLNFIKGNPQRAMAAYKRAYNRMNEMCSNERLNMEQRRKLFGDRSRLALKIARNYMLLQEPEQAVIYYKDVCDVNDTLLMMSVFISMRSAASEMTNRPKSWRVVSHSANLIPTTNVISIRWHRCPMSSTITDAEMRITG